MSINNDQKTIPLSTNLFELESLPSELHEIISRELSPYQLIQLSQANRGWHSLIDRDRVWSPRKIGSNSSSLHLKKAEDVWQSFFGVFQGEEFKSQENRIAKLYADSTQRLSFQSESFRRTTNMYQDLFVQRFQGLTFKEAYYVFGESYGMSLARVTRMYLKRHSDELNIEIGNYHSVAGFPEISQKEIVKECVDQEKFGLVLANLDMWQLGNQGSKIVEHFLGLVNKSINKENVADGLYGPSSDKLLKFFYDKAKEEISTDPHSSISHSLRPVIDAIHTGALSEALDVGAAVMLVPYSLSWIPLFKGAYWASLALNLGGITCALTAGGLTYFHERAQLISSLISAFPEYKAWKKQLIRMHFFENFSILAKSMLGDDYFCPGSGRLLVRAVKTPDGKVYDRDWLLKKSRKKSTPLRYMIEELVPDFKMIYDSFHQIKKLLKDLQKENPAFFSDHRHFFNAIDKLIEEKKNLIYDELYKSFNKALTNRWAERHALERDFEVKLVSDDSYRKKRVEFMELEKYSEVERKFQNDYRFYRGLI